MVSKYWKTYIGKRVRLMIEDKPHPKPKDGICIDVDEVSLFLEIEGTLEIKPFLLTTIRRVDVKEIKEKEEVNGDRH